MQSVALIDYGSGNLRSAEKALQKAAMESGLEGVVSLARERYCSGMASSRSVQYTTPCASVHRYRRPARGAAGALDGSAPGGAMDGGAVGGFGIHTHVYGVDTPSPRSS